MSKPIQSEREKLIQQITNVISKHEGVVEPFVGELADYILQREREARVDENEYWLRNRALLEKAGETGAALLVDSLQLKARIYTLRNKEAVLAALTPKSTEPSLPKNASATPQDSTASKEQL